ncbi:MAG: penicillin-binding protein activator LpoB [Betaproteobacteria bacterium]|nr:penicillin-binding protein activator LpoB [Betaproteobacteria bacterium]NBY14601.1 penicillin-binding protein activator LpoB [Betaproteobacteria bacterium]
MTRPARPDPFLAHPLALLLAASLLSACSSTPRPAPPAPAPQVRYGDAKAIETVTVDFGSTDLQMMAETMTRSLLQHKVISAAREAPTVTLAEVRNKTGEAIDTRVITEKVRTALTKSGQVRFAVSANEMQPQVSELKRQNQSGMYRNDTAARMGNMVAARFRIEGSISTIVKQTADVRDVFYIFTLNLVNNESGLIEWAEEKEIRKIASR